MGKAALIALPLVLLLTGCATAPAPAEDPRRIWCDHNTPRRPTLKAIEQMSRSDLDEINVHNDIGARWCGWTP